MKNMAAALIMVFGIILTGAYEYRGQDVEVSLVSRQEASYLLVSGVTTVPQTSKVVTVDYDGKYYSIIDSKLYESFTEGKKVKLALGSTYNSDIK